MLGRMRLWSVAAQVMRASGDAAIQVQNTMSTSYHLSCCWCHKALPRAGAVCPHCRKGLSSCSICSQTVSGLYAWCQGCGHGGHVRHLREWFSRQSLCPAGCGHACTPSYGARGSHLQTEATAAAGATLTTAAYAPLAAQASTGSHIAVRVKS